MSYEGLLFMIDTLIYKHEFFSKNEILNIFSYEIHNRTWRNTEPQIMKCEEERKLQGCFIHGAFHLYVHMPQNKKKTMFWRFSVRPYHAKLYCLNQRGSYWSTYWSPCDWQNFLFMDHGWFGGVLSLYKDFVTCSCEVSLCSRESKKTKPCPVVTAWWNLRYPTYWLTFNSTVKPLPQRHCGTYFCTCLPNPSKRSYVRLKTLFPFFTFFLAFYILMLFFFLADIHGIRSITTS